MLEFDQSYIDLMKSLETPSENEIDDIEKAFSIINEAYLLNQIPQDVFEKAQRTYINNAENRRLKRVGKPYGSNAQEEPKQGKEAKQEPSKEGKEKSLEDHAKEASEADLQRTVKESGDEKLRQAAHQELDRREKEEHVQEEEDKKLPVGEKPTVDTQKESGTAGKDSDSGSVSKEDYKKETQEIYNLKDKVDSAKLKFKQGLEKFCKENNLQLSSIAGQIKFKQTEEGQKLQKYIWDSNKELMNKVDSSKNKRIIPFYSVSLETNESGEELYSGYDKEEAESVAQSVDDKDNPNKYSTSSVLIRKRNDEFVFAGNVEDGEAEEDYPLEDDYSRDKYVQTSKQNEFELLDSFDLKGSEQTAQELDLGVRNWLSEEYGRDSYKSYDSIVLGQDKDGKDITMQIRVKNHSENPQNKQKSSADEFLSIVVANKDATAQRFHSGTELYFTGNDKLEDIKEQVSDYIQDTINRSGVVKLDSKMIKAGLKLNED